MKKTWLHKKCIPAAGLALVFAVQTAMPVQAAAEERLVNAAGEDEIRYIREDGAYAPERWVLRDGDWFYLNESGDPMTDTVVLAMDDRYYALDKEGRRLTSGTAFSGGLPWVIESDGTASVEISEDEEAIREAAEEKVRDITEGCRTPEEMALAIYEEVWHLDTVPTDELEGKMQKAAIKAFDQHSGNCFGQAAMMHYLLQAAGIPDMTVAARDEEGLIGHWWNLVKLGDYYYHMDATPYRGDPEPVLLTTEEFMEFWDDLEGVRPMHVFDEWNYPKSGDTQRRKSEQKEEAEQQEETEQEEDI